LPGVDEYDRLTADDILFVHGKRRCIYPDMRIGVDLRRSAYDLDAAARRIPVASDPAAEEFAATNVLQPPTEQQMLDRF